MVLAVIVGYLLGSIPCSLLVARRYGINLYETADGNPGAWNALEQLGARRAWPAFAGDALKALCAGLIGHALGGWWAAWAGVAGGKGGPRAPAVGRKSVMFFVGGPFALAPVAAAGWRAMCL